MRRSALVIEGGGMRAAFSNGVLTSFAEAGWQGPVRGGWSRVVGTSAGGALAAWYSAGQARFAEATWAYAADRRILSYLRLLLRRPVLDHARLIDEVYAQEHPLDLAQLCRARWPVVVTASDVDRAQCHYQDLRRGDALAWLKATGRVPVAAGPPVQIGARRYLDGGILDPIPLRHAIENGATDVVLVLTEPVAAYTGRRRDPAWLTHWAARRYPALADAMHRHAALKAQAVRLAAAPPDGVDVAIVAPATPLGVGRLTRDLPRLQRAIAAGHAAGAAFLAEAGSAGGRRKRARRRAARLFRAGP